jgi:hypothetical protein
MARWAGHVARVGDNKNVYVVFMGILEGKGSLGRRRLRWKDDIEMDLKELGWKDVNAIQLARGRDQWHVLVNVLTNLHVHKIRIC